MSSLTVAIGDVERLTDLQPDQMERLWKAVARLGNAVAAKSDD
jgi:diadenosine tetraphosphate (Ap4A) HIT family hydrolase